MADVQWIKITVNMFDNRKIKHLRRLPDGDSIVLIWVMLLTMAGRCNSGGMIFLTENIPYTPKMLADELDFEESTVQLALKALEQLGMICTNSDGFLAVTGWEEHQNIAGMEKIRESKRLAQARWRAKQAAIAGKSTVDSTVESTRISVDDAEEDIDIEEDKMNTSSSTSPSDVQRVNGAYTFGIPNDTTPDTAGIPDGYQMDTQVRLGQDSIGKDSVSIKSASQPSPAAVDAFFDSVWKLYPVKKGKGQVSKSKRLALYKIGFDELSRAIDRYTEDLQKDATWRKPQNGSTFFNSGYVDYLDANYVPDTVLRAIQSSTIGPNGIAIAQDADDDELLKYF